jgi:dipeptide/tripeptide permease
VFWAALAFIIVGSGFLKANISVMVGQLYKLTDIRRDGAYTVFYMGINVGAALGTILVAYLGQTIGWGYGFGLAGIGMVLGLVVFVVGKKALNGAGEAPAPLAKGREWTIYAIGVGAVAGLSVTALACVHLAVGARVLGGGTAGVSGAVTSASAARALTPSSSTAIDSERSASKT